ncbi:MAG: hypothetical protein HRU09_01645 [Oligoflexales bacterium]|nr:hypothetical protein [Oligoflexales bacterium]
MNINHNLMVLTIFIASFMYQPGSLFALGSHEANQEIISQQNHGQMILLAQKSRKKRLSAEGKIRKTGDKTVIDFESVDIVGDRRTPIGSMINQSRAEKDYDFVKIRLRWHPEMKKSASSLDTQ